MNEEGRFLEGVSGNLYDADSPAYHASLEQLRDLLIDIGFTVSKKAPRETTLRVYPAKPAPYPLLNPRFIARDELHGPEGLMVQVLSKDDNGSIDRQLGTFSPTAACTFVVYPADAGEGYHYHGAFILPLHFSGNPGRQEIDFASLRAPLTQILALLRQPVPDQGSLAKLRDEVQAMADQIDAEYANKPGEDVDAVVKRRVGQGPFRDLLELKYGVSCCVSGVSKRRLLIASHIVRWSKSTQIQKTDPENGLLLSVAWDALFDKGFVSFDDEGRLLRSAELDDDTIQHLGLSIDVTLPENLLTERRKENLSWHRRRYGFPSEAPLPQPTTALS